MNHGSSAAGPKRGPNGAVRRRTAPRGRLRGTSSPTHEASASTKARILATAEEVFATRGFAGASTREIAAKAAVNISSLHYHWESKETLYYAVFQNIYDRIVEIVRLAIPPAIAGAASGRAVIEDAVGTLFDFFADHPNIPKLLVRRLLENDENHVDVEGTILVPAWKVFGAWMRKYGGPRVHDVDLQLFMLTIHSVVLLFLLDSRHVTSVLGGSVRTPAVRRRVREHIVHLVETALGLEATTRKSR